MAISLQVNNCEDKKKKPREACEWGEIRPAIARRARTDVRLEGGEESKVRRLTVDVGGVVGREGEM